MKFMTHFFLAPQKPDSMPYCFSNPTGEFDSWQDVRRVAHATADDQTHSIVIELLEPADQAAEERWVRDGDKWKREDA